MQSKVRQDRPLRCRVSSARKVQALLLSGFSAQGLHAWAQQKEQRKTAQAQATINAADAASEAATLNIKRFNQRRGKQDIEGAGSLSGVHHGFQAVNKPRRSLSFLRKRRRGKRLLRMRVHRSGWRGRRGKRQ